MTKILFVLKYREISDSNGNSYSHGGLSSGLFNSASMIKEMLDRFGINGRACQSEVVQVIDNNGIDREVTRFKPDIVVVEAFWVVPAKFEVLTKLHPTVKWIVRGHSNIPFLAGEGNAIRWAAEYVTFPNVFVATNTTVSLADLRDIILERYTDAEDRMYDQKIVYFPNFYIASDIEEQGLDIDTKPEKHDFVERTLSFLHFYVPKKYKHKGRHELDQKLDVGCFGAVRLLKNHLVQAVAALRYAKKTGQRLYFHINSGRVEGGGDPVLKNLRSLFSSAQNAELVEHPWMPHAEFVKLIDSMDVSLQVSFSETFNIVTADAVSCGVPVVVSKEISWVASKYFADPVNAGDIAQKMEEAIKDSRRGDHNINQTGLNAYNRRSHVAISETLEAVKCAKHHYHGHYSHD